MFRLKAITMGLKSFIWLCFLLGMILPPSSAFASSESKPVAQSGVLDLTRWDFAKDGSVPLDGEWEFYWNTLAEPGDFLSVPPAGMRYTVVPHVWGGAGKVAPEREGYATYRLTINLDSSGQDKLKSLYIRNAATAYRVWINGELAAENGKVGRSVEEMTPKNYSKVVTFPARSGSNEMIIQVSNFVQRKGGLWSTIEIGAAESIARQRESNIASQIFIASALFIMGSYHFALYLMRKRDMLSLLTGGYCMLMSMRTLLLGDTLLVRFFPSIDWQLAVKVEYLCPYLGIPIFSVFVHYLYPKETNKTILRVICWVSILFSMIVILFPARIFTYTMMTFQVFLMIVILYLYYVLIMAALHKRVGSLLNIAASMIIVLTAWHDILYYNQIIRSFDLAPYGVLAYFFIQTLVVAQKFSKAYYEVEDLSKELAEMNQKLEEKIKERTEALEVSNAYLVYTNEHLNRVENSRRELIGNITHELGTPMTSIQGYMKALLDGVIQPEKQYIQIIYDKIQTADRLVQDLFDLTKLEEGQTTFHMVDIIVDELFSDHFSMYQWEVESQGIRFELVPPEGPEDMLAIVRIDPIRIRQVVANLVQNALNYTEEGGLISIRGEYQNERLLIRVEDTGKGIDPALLPNIFDRFVKGTAPRRNSKNGTGLGLAIAKEIVLHHGGIMQVRSELGKGSQFEFDIPLEYIPMVVN